MQFNLNIPDWLRIPLKILLPCAWFFSAIMIWSPDSLLKRLHLFVWRNNNGFWLGLVFVICTCLIGIYFLYYIISLLVKLFRWCTRNIKTAHALSKLNDSELDVLLLLYRSPNYTAKLDYNQPIISGLLERGYIYSSRMQITRMGYGDSLLISCTLQPDIWQCLSHIQKKNK